MFDRLTTPRGMSRRHFLGHLAATSLSVPAASFLGALRANAQEMRRNQKHCILLWMGGGPSQLDTWDLKPDSPRNGGEFKPIATSVPGIQISEHLPNVAKQMQHLSLIRSLSTSEGNHDRGTYLMHTGYQPNPTVVHPSFGSVCSFELGTRLGDEFPLPHFVSINRPGESAGFLGMAHAPFVVGNPNGQIENLKPGVDAARLNRRIQMLGMVEDRFIGQNRGAAAVGHRDVYGKTLKMMNSSYTKAFEISNEPDAVRDAYGRSGFGSGCLMARRLVQAGVTFVEVGLGGWDNHDDIFRILREQRLPELDKGMGALIADLNRLGLLQDTLVVWMGEFGRTPRINQNGGRDHWPRSWSVALGGAGIKGGQVVGATDTDGIDVTDRQVGVMDLIATMCTSLGIHVDTEYTTPLGRPMKIVDGGSPITELI